MTNKLSVAEEGSSSMVVGVEEGWEEKLAIEAQVFESM